MRTKRRSKQGPIRAAGIMLVLAAVSLAQSPPRASTANVSANSLGQLTGIVTDAAGYPEAGAVVQIRPANRHAGGWERITSERGIFTLDLLAPGSYLVDVGKGSRTALPRKIQIHASERMVLLVSLPELAGEVQFGSRPPANASEAQQLRWALRQPPAWRPVFRLRDPSISAGGDVPADNGESAEVASNDAGSTDGYVSLTAGGDTQAFSEGNEVATAFHLNTALWGTSRMALQGDLSTSGAYPDSSLQVMLRPSADASSQSRLLLGIRDLPTPALNNLPGLQVVTLNYADGVDLTDRLRVQYGSMLTTVSTSSLLHTFDPYLRAAYRIGEHGSLEYRLTSAVPPLMFGSDVVSMVDPTPRISLDRNRVNIERAHHQEVLFSDDLSGNDSVSAAVFSERYDHTALNGAMADSEQMAGGDMLPDLLSNMFTADGGSYGGVGYRLVYQRRLGDNLDAAFSYATGSVLAPTTDHLVSNWTAALAPTRAAAWTMKVNATVPRIRTQLICSYRGLNRLAVTGLDLYDNGAAQSDSYANVALRQPLPHLMGPGNRLEALVQVNNLLAQGYVPMIGSDGHTMFLVQSARSVRGGFSINF